jgi:hypothetical protein
MSGYWRKYEELLELLVPLLSILSIQKEDFVGIDDKKFDNMTDNEKQLKYKKFKEEAVKCIPSVNLIIKCKQLVCDLV